MFTARPIGAGSAADRVPRRAQPSHGKRVGGLADVVEKEGAHRGARNRGARLRTRAERLGVSGARDRRFAADRVHELDPQLRELPRRCARQARAPTDERGRRQPLARAVAGQEASRRVAQGHRRLARPGHEPRRLAPLRRHGGVAFQGRALGLPRLVARRRQAGVRTGAPRRPGADHRLRLRRAHRDEHDERRLGQSPAALVVGRHEAHVLQQRQRRQPRRLHGQRRRDRPGRR